jgi:hypothetical protein
MLNDDSQRMEIDMKPIRWMVVASFAACVSGAVLAQGGAGAGMGPGPGMQGAGPGASAPGMGMGPGARAGRGMGARAGAGVTPGWALMTPAERTEHQTRMRSMKTHEECKTYMGQHHEQMVARAKEKGVTVPGQPRRDPCAGLKP